MQHSLYVLFAGLTLAGTIFFLSEMIYYRFREYERGWMGYLSIAFFFLAAIMTVLWFDTVWGFN